MSLEALNSLDNKELEQVIKSVRSIINRRYYESNREAILLKRKNYRAKRKC